MIAESHRGKTNFIRVSAWGEAAKIASFLNKGDHVFIEGRLQCRIVNETSVKKEVVEIVAWTILKIDRSHLDSRGDDSDR